MLHIERATRGSRRAFIRSQDLTDDWTVPVHALGEQLDLAAIKLTTAELILRGHDLISTRPRGNEPAWRDLEVPRRLRDIAAETDRVLGKLTDAGQDAADLHETLDALREDYADLYLEAEALVQSTIGAATRAAVAEATRDAANKPNNSAAPAPAPPLGDRLALHIPHGLRALIPPRARQRVKRILNRIRKR
jgi:hypothetical protein